MGEDVSVFAELAFVATNLVHTSFLHYGMPHQMSCLERFWLFWPMLQLATATGAVIFAVCWTIGQAATKEHEDYENFDRWMMCDGDDAQHAECEPDGAMFYAVFGGGGYGWWRAARMPLLSPEQADHTLDHIEWFLMALAVV